MIRSAFLLLMLVFTTGAAAQVSKPIVLSPEDGAKEGAELVERMRSMEPGEPTTTSGVLTIKRPKAPALTIPFRFEIKPAEGGWQSVYEAPDVSTGISKLWVTRTASGTNSYSVVENGTEKVRAAENAFVPFAGSDFWIVDLGLDFLWWPEQRVLRKEIRRGQSCAVLESTNPNPSPGSYSRVLSWVDIDTGGIINAEAYGPDKKRIKDFAASKFKKIEGKWELKEIEMYDRRADSRTTLTFDLGAK